MLTARTVSTCAANSMRGNRRGGNSPCRQAAPLEKMSSLEGCASEGAGSQQSDGSQCDAHAFTSARRAAPQQPLPHRAASLPECLQYPPAQQQRLRQQQKQKQQQREQQRGGSPLLERGSFSSDEGSEMDADCCGDSGVARAVTVSQDIRVGDPCSACSAPNCDTAAAGCHSWLLMLLVNLQVPSSSSVCLRARQSLCRLEPASSPCPPEPTPSAASLSPAPLLQMRCAALG